jgi:NifU-like protein involved in Fe-S cluster formation
MEPEMSYEDEQIQQIMMNELVEKKRKNELELIERQNTEYEECLEKDLKQPISKPIVIFEEVSVEEMRRVRLLRFK